MRFLVILVLAMIAAPMSSIAASENQHTGAGHASPYAGQEKRVIKSLSEKDIDDLKNGRGWGLAKAAELNGIPGPSHLLEMRKEIALTSEQITAIENLFADMKAKAVPLGERLIELERNLNQAFANRHIDAEKLKSSLDEIARVNGELRFVHLVTHLATPDLLTRKQIAAYNRLRGYEGQDHSSKH